MMMMSIIVVVDDAEENNKDYDVDVAGDDDTSQLRHSII